MIALAQKSVLKKLSVTDLTFESAMRDLPLYHCDIDVNQIGRELSVCFEDNPTLPGIILRDCKAFEGMISRRKFLELMTRPYGPELFLNRAIHMLYRFARHEVLILSGDTKIAEAASTVFRQSSECLNEPIVIQLDEQNYRLLDIHDFLLAHSNIHELTTKLLQEESQAKLFQTEKMASLGEMLAGVAHEISNPVNFILGNLEHLSGYGRNILDALNLYDQELGQSSQKLEDFKESVELDFIVQDLPNLISSMRMGAERLKQIVSALRHFSHMDELSKRPVDIEECLDNTLLILNNRLKYSTTVIKNYGKLPIVSCYSGQISQVFTNIIGNAIDALSERTESCSALDWQAQITIETKMVASGMGGSGEAEGDRTQWAGIFISDNGAGIPLEIQAKIFQSFFTTKPPGKGTGLGLAISRQIVVDKHGGQLNFQSQLNRGTTFEILLPL